MLPTLHRYWLKEFIKLFFIIQMMILVLFVFIDYLTRMDKILNSDLGLLGGLVYVLLKVPFMFVQLTPAGILLAVVVVFALMNRNNELVALKSSGISVYFLVKPAILSGCVLAFFIFFLVETIIPVTIAKANYIRNFVLKKRTNISHFKKDIWIKSGRQLVNFKHFNISDQSVSGVTVSSMNDKFLLDSRISAAKGYYENGTWVFKQVMEVKYKEGHTDYDVLSYDSKKMILEVKPEDLGDVVKKSNEMSFFELKRYVKKVENEGYDATIYKVDLWAKISFPFICVIMALTGAATGMRSFVKENMPVAVAIGIMISFLYWIMFGFCISLGYGAVLPPVVAAWAANLFCICFGTIYLINAE
ncbi:MAG: LPS export ABC transporter permease LptG [Desulfobacteraceae bacterium]|nr:LPS export ABC transporter permease LptG [Desulfobacteraceae bacterium]